MRFLKEFIVFVVTGCLFLLNCLSTARAEEENRIDYTPSALSLNFKEIEISTGKTIQLSAVTEFGDSVPDVLWQSSDDRIASVDETGMVSVSRYGKATITAVYNEDSSLTASCTITSRFFDVDSSSKYYYKPVYWAAEKGITTGYDKVYFGPQQNCTRRELSIFLWRLAGKPAVSGSLPFSDTKGYKTSTDTYKAILWCYRNGIVKGYSDGTFKPDASIVRKDTMIMLYRLAGKPKVTGTMKFGDVKALNYPSASDTYKSIIWGTDSKITNGYSDGSFKPLENCLREHIVTFIYRYNKMVNPDDVSSTVTFDANDGSAVKKITVENGDTVSAPENPVREGYIFAGWYTSKEFDEAFLFDKDVINEDITLYAAWQIETDDTLLAAYVAQQMEIVYQQGDHADHVTRDIILPTVFEGAEDVKVTWHSSNAAISADGTVTRPYGENTSVKLTVTAQKNDASFSIDHLLEVIHAHERDISEISDNSVIDIEAMNPDGDCVVSYNDSRTQITSIDGKFSDIVVENADDALDVIQSIHTIVGINDPYNELELLASNSDEYGSGYTFEQEYNGMPVYGRRITVTADRNGITDSLSSGLYASDRLAELNYTPAISAETAESYVLDLYKGDCTVDSDETILSVYSINEYVDTPVLAYIVNISGQDAEGEFVYDRVFVDADTSEIIKKSENTARAFYGTVNGSGEDESGKKTSFPVLYYSLSGNIDTSAHFLMSDINRNIYMFTGICKNDYPSDFVESKDNTWTDKTAVSAYTNLIKTYDWYKQNLKRKGIDGNGSIIQATVHNNYRYDNASWNYNRHTLNFSDNSESSTSTRTTAGQLDVVAHEYTHGVVQYTTGDIGDTDIGSAINEGYADIMGCLIEGNWLMGEHLSAKRDISNPASFKGPDKLSSPYNDENANDHALSSLVSYPAYLMAEKYGMSRRTLALLWYESIKKGYDASSTFHTVRRNVLKAAKGIGLSYKEIDIVRHAFDDVEIYGPKGDLEVTVTDSDGKEITDAEIIVVENRQKLDLNNHSYKCRLDAGAYSIKVKAEGYLEHYVYFRIEESETTTLDIVLVREGNSKINGSVVNAVSAQPLKGVQLTVRSGFNVKDGPFVAKSATDENGEFSFEVNAGYYTIEMVFEGYTTEYRDVWVQDGKTAVIDASLSPVTSSHTYRVVLTWGALPEDLDSHLEGRDPDGNDFHIYYSDQVATKADGTEIGNLDVDDTTSYGPETTTFVAEPTGKYYFYVHRYSSDGTLPASGAEVVVYNRDNVVRKFKINPNAPSDSLYWNVFKIERGILYPSDTYAGSSESYSDTSFLLHSISEKHDKAVGAASADEIINDQGGSESLSDNEEDE